MKSENENPEIVKPMSQEEYIFEGEMFKMDIPFSFDGQTVELPQSYFERMANNFRNYFETSEQLRDSFSNKSIEEELFVFKVVRKIIISKKTGKELAIYDIYAKNLKKLKQSDFFTIKEINFLGNASDIKRDEDFRKAFKEGGFVHANLSFFQETDPVRIKFNPTPYFKINSYSLSNRSLGIGGKKLIPQCSIRTTYGIYDGIKKPKDWINFLSDRGVDFAVFTDFGGVHSFPEIESANKKLGDKKIKIGYGVSLFVEDTNTLEKRKIKFIASDKKSLKSIYEHISMYGSEKSDEIVLPMSTIQNLRKDGVIVISPTIRSHILDAIISGNEVVLDNYDFVEISPLNQYMDAMSDIYDKYGELISKKISKKQMIDNLGKVFNLCKNKNIPILYSQNPRFFHSQEQIFRDMLLYNRKIVNMDGNDCFYPGEDDAKKSIGHIFPDQDAESLFEDFCINSYEELKSRIGEVQIIPDDLYLPTIAQIPDTRKELTKLVLEGLEEKYGKNYKDVLPKDVLERIKFELASINKKYSVIYISSRLAIKKSEELGYMVGSRGSVGSSVVAFLSGISEVNPLPPHYRCYDCGHSDFEVGDDVRIGVDLPTTYCPKCKSNFHGDGWNIEFSTFMGFDGSKVADIDLNFSGDVQKEVMKYISDELFPSRSFRAGTVLTLNEDGQSKEFSKILGVNEAKNLFFASKVLGVKYATGKHAGGIMIVPREYDPEDFTPINNASDSGSLSTHFEYSVIHDNLLKMDILGSDSITFLEKLASFTGVPHQGIDWNSQDVLEIFKSGDTWGINEFTTENAINMLEDIKPTKWQHLCSMSGLQHGTGVWSGNAKEIINRGIANIDEIDGCRDEIVESLTKLLNDAKKAFDIVESVRKGKGIPEKFEDELIKLVPEWYFNYLNKIEYMFPKAHAAAYLIISAKQAWYKLHHRGDFYSVYLSINSKYVDASWNFASMDQLEGNIQVLEKQLREPGTKNIVVKKKKISSLKMMIEARKSGFVFESPHVNFSRAKDFSCSGNKIFSPILTIGGAGEKFSNSLVEERDKNGLFKDIEDLYIRLSPKDSIMESINNFENFGSWHKGKKDEMEILKKEKKNSEKLEEKIAQACSEGFVLWEDFEKISSSLIVS